MVKLVFNPKKNNQKDVGISKITKKPDLTELFASLNPFKGQIPNEFISLKNVVNEKLPPEQKITVENEFDF